MPFLRRRSTAAPTVGAPVAAPVATPITKPPSFGTGLPAAPAPAPAPGTPSLSDAITQLKGGNRQSAEDMMRQIVGLPPLNAPGTKPPVNDIPSPRLPEDRPIYGGPVVMPEDRPIYGGPVVMEPQPAVPPPNIEKPITIMPVPGPNVAAPYPQAPFGNPAQSPGAMQQYLEQQNLLAQRMNQQSNPFQQLAGPNPYMQQAPAIPLGMQVQQPSYMQSPEFQGYQTQMQDLRRQMDEYMQKAPMYQQIQDLQGKMQQYRQQNMNQFQPYTPQRMTMDMPQAQQPMPEFPTQPPMGIQQQTFGQTMPPMQQQAFGQTQPPMQQQAFGQTQPPMQQPASPAANMMSNAGFGPQVSAAFGSNMQPQNPVQPMGQFQQNNAQQMSNFQNQSQPAQNTQQNRGGMFGRRFGGGSFGGGGGGGGLF